MNKKIETQKIRVNNWQELITKAQEYKNSSKKEEKEIKLENLKTIQDYLKKHNNSVDLEQLKSGSNSSTITPNKKSDYTFWLAGGVAVLLTIGIFVYWIRKRKNKKNLASK